MTELDYALNNGVFTVNGVKATGTFAQVSLLGIQLGDVDGSIDTFMDPPPRYRHCCSCKEECIVTHETSTHD